MNLLWPTATAHAELRADEAHVWAVPVDSAPLAQTWSILSQDERERAERFRLDEPRRQFVGSRAALRMLLGKYLGIPPTEIDFAYDAGGKPRLHDETKLDGLRFNLAHSGDLAVVVVARGCDVGI